jgi:YHS domain-containing protein
MNALPDCEECGEQIIEPYEIQGHYFCSSACALKFYRDRQAERLEYEQRNRKPTENVVRLAGYVC